VLDKIQEPSESSLGWHTSRLLLPPKFVQALNDVEMLLQHQAIVYLQLSHLINLLGDVFLHMFIHIDTCCYEMSNFVIGDTFETRCPAAMLRLVPCHCVAIYGKLYLIYTSVAKVQRCCKVKARCRFDEVGGGSKNPH
jgi:hypothetical protein